MADPLEAENEDRGKYVIAAFLGSFLAICLEIRKDYSERHLK